MEWNRATRIPMLAPSSGGLWCHLEESFQVTMSVQELTATSAADLMQRVVAQQQEILDRLERMERFQSLSLVKESYTTGEAAERLGRSEWTVRQWCNKGQVKGATKVRGKGRTGEWRLSHEAIVALQSEGPLPVGARLAA